MTTNILAARRAVVRGDKSGYTEYFMCPIYYHLHTVIHLISPHLLNSLPRTACRECVTRGKSWLFRLAQNCHVTIKVLFDWFVSVRRCTCEMIGRLLSSNCRIAKGKFNNSPNSVKSGGGLIATGLVTTVTSPITWCCTCRVPLRVVTW